MTAVVALLITLVALQAFVKGVRGSGSRGGGRIGGRGRSGGALGGRGRSGSNGGGVGALRGPGRWSGRWFYDSAPPVGSKQSLMGPVGGPLPWRPLVGLAILGVFLNQLVFLKGLALTSPVVAGALQPSIPIFTFILAVALGSESLNLRRRDGVFKLAGVLLCVLGALITSTYQGEAGHDRYCLPLLPPHSRPSFVETNRIT